MTLRLLQNNILKKLSCALKIAIAKRRPRVSSVHHVNVISRIDHPFVAAKAANVIISLPLCLATEGFAQVKMHFSLPKLYRNRQYLSASAVRRRADKRRTLVKPQRTAVQHHIVIFNDAPLAHSKGTVKDPPSDVHIVKT